MEIDAAQALPVPQSGALIDGFTVPEVRRQQGFPMLAACTRGTHKDAVEGETQKLSTNFCCIHTASCCIVNGVTDTCLHEQAGTEPMAEWQK